MTDTYDYVVVGGGSAGCTITNRLVEAGKRVLMLEAGPPDTSRYIDIPATFSRVIGTERTWIYETEPQAEVGGQRMPVPQGKTLGGGSSVNAMVYIRGQAADYDGWKEAGCTGWGYDDVLPVFTRLEKNERLAGPYHGTTGLLPVSDPRYRHPLSLAFVQAAQQAGYAYNDDFNGAEQAGVGFFQTTTSGGKRQSAAATFLRKVAGRKNLTVETGALVTQVTLENGAASGIRYRRADGTPANVAASEEVILAAGALATPKLLMLSGIGPGEQLAALGIDVKRDISSVGRNFQDHISVPLYALTREPISLLGEDKGLRAIRHGLEYLLFRRGLLSSNVVESGGFFDTDGDGRPDVQFHTLPVMVENAVHGSVPLHGMEMNPCVLRPKSKGIVSLRSSDPADPIVFNANYLAEPEDQERLVAGLKLARKFLRQPALQAVISAERAPGPDIGDDDLMDHIRTHAKTVYHPSGTCRMGADAGATVDTQLRVVGVPRLRICDASVMPALVSGNTNAPTIMIADRCADFVLGTAG